MPDMCSRHVIFWARSTCSPPHHVATKRRNNLSRSPAWMGTSLRRRYNGFSRMSDVLMNSRICCLVVLIGSIVVPLRMSWAQNSHPDKGKGPSGGSDWILLIDTSLSMSGRARGSRNIFPDVRKSVKQLFAALAGDADTFYVYTFDTRPKYLGM